MTNTFIVPGEVTPQDLIAGVEDGLYVKNWYGGMTSMEMSNALSSKRTVTE